MNTNIEENKRYQSYELDDAVITVDLSFGGINVVHRDDFLTDNGSQYPKRLDVVHIFQKGTFHGSEESVKLLRFAADLMEKYSLKKREDCFGTNDIKFNNK